MNFKFQPPSKFVAFHKNGYFESCSSFEDLPEYKMSCSHAEWCKCCIHRKSVNVRHFGMVQDAGLRSMASRSSSVA
jgi:hypothetical protein